MSSSSLSMLLLRRERDGQPPRLDVAPADPSFDKQRWSVVDMSQARDEEGHAVVSLVMETPTRGIGYAIRYASSPGGSSHQQDCFTTTVKKVNVHQELLDESILTTLRRGAGSAFPCVVRPKKIVRVIRCNESAACLNDDHADVHGAVALCWQQCSAHGGSCWKAVPWGDVNAHEAAAAESLV